jgi:hypothetical protein
MTYVHPSNFIIVFIIYSKKAVFKNNYLKRSVNSEHDFHCLRLDTTIIPNVAILREFKSARRELQTRLNHLNAGLCLISGGWFVFSMTGQSLHSECVREFFSEFMVEKLDGIHETTLKQVQFDEQRLKEFKLRMEATQFWDIKMTSKTTFKMSIILRIKLLKSSSTISKIMREKSYSLAWPSITL